MKLKIKIDNLTISGKIAYDFVEALQDKEGITYLDIEDYTLEIDPFTVSGRKAYEFIESLEDKEGITYPDFNEDDYMTEDEFFEELEKAVITYINERNRNMQQLKLKKILKRIRIKTKKNTF